MTPDLLQNDPDQPSPSGRGLWARGLSVMVVLALVAHAAVGELATSRVAFQTGHETVVRHWSAAIVQVVRRWAQAQTHKPVRVEAILSARRSVRFEAAPRWAVERIVRPAMTLHEHAMPPPSVA